MENELHHYLNKKVKIVYHDGSLILVRIGIIKKETSIFVLVDFLDNFHQINPRQTDISINKNSINKIEEI